MTSLISLGSWCISANIIKESKKRKQAYPFDWIKLSLVNIVHILEDDFKHFIDPNYLCRTESKEFLQNVEIEGQQISNTYYDIKNCFVHHNPLDDVDNINYFIRCIERFRNIKYLKEEIAFLIFFHEEVSIAKECFIKIQNILISKFQIKATLIGISHKVSKKQSYTRVYETNDIFMYQISSDKTWGADNWNAQSDQNIIFEIIGTHIKNENTYDTVDTVDTTHTFWHGKKDNNINL